MHDPKRLWTACSTLLLVALALVAVGCDEETVGPQTEGQVEGTVLDAQTNEPVARANVTTSPPTQSVLTDSDGTFSLGNVPTGNYTVQASKSDYESRSVTVNVTEGRTATATILLERADDFGSSNDSLRAQVTNWFNDRVNRDTTGADSIFVDVEYSALNVGDVRIRRYEIYFDITTPDGTFSKEIEGDSLDVGQRDIGGFRKFVTAEGEDVRVTDVYTVSDDE